MKHMKRISRGNRPQSAYNLGEVLHYIDSFGWLLVNFMNYFTAYRTKVV